MIAGIRRYIGSRIARRLFLVLILCAFVPLAVMSSLSLLQVRGLLMQQGEQRLASIAKTYGMSVFERLLVAADVALAASAGPVPTDAVLETRTFRSLVQYDPDGHERVILGRPQLLPLSDEERERLRSGKLLLRVTGGNARPRIELFAPRTPRSLGHVGGELQPEYVWGPGDELPTAVDFCVLEDRWRTLIHCSSPMPPAALQGGLEWARDGEQYRSRSWTQFMRGAFGSPDWIVVAAQPERVQLARASEFARTYVPVMLLSLLLVLLFTVRQSRDISVPVEKLAARARGIAGQDFGGTTGLERDDELGELADSFDEMSRQLGRQFATLKALSEIDQLILATQDTAEIIAKVLQRLREVTGADSVTVLHFDDADMKRIRTYAIAETGEVGAATRDDLSAEDQSALAQGTTEWPRLEGRVLPPFLARLRGAGMGSAYVNPVIWRNSPCGAVVLGYRDGRLPNEEERRTVRELGDRVAVAVSTAWRDRQLYQQSYFDPVTGAPNRLLFRDRLAIEIARSKREGLRFAVLFVDLDHFKHVNDSYGHSTGDAILRESFQRMTRCLRASDSVARLGGDEFTVLLPNLEQPQEAWLLAETVVAELSREFIVGEHHCFLSASIGIAAYPTDGQSEEALLKSGDTAMYRAKAAGRGQSVFFEERMNDEAIARMALDRDLRVAIERGELQLVYQPQVCLHTGAVIGAEALVRWMHPIRGSIPPLQFIPLAEESGFIDTIGQWVVQQASRQMRAWADQGVPLPRVAVNVSPRQFRRRDFADFIARTVAAAGIEPARLEVEVTEGLLVDRGGAAEALLREIAGRGHPVALDDFGTGFSSMSYLGRLPVHLLKIDRVFVEQLDHGHEGEAIVAAIIAMAHAMGKRVIAEGVERPEQLAILRRLACDAVQGFFHARPMPPAELAAFVRHAASAAAPLPVAPIAL